MAKLSDNQKYLLRLVIMAAQEGRFLHGNGATWSFVKKGEPNIVTIIDHTRSSTSELSASESASYLRSNRPHKDETVAKSLESLISSN